jgi:hypothetical protein
MNNSEDMAAEQIAGAGVVFVVAGGGSCSWPADFAIDSAAAAELGRSRWKARSWAVAASDCSLLATSEVGHMAMTPGIGLVQ